MSDEDIAGFVALNAVVSWLVVSAFLFAVQGWPFANSVGMGLLIGSFGGILVGPAFIINATAFIVVVVWVLAEVVLFLIP